MLNTSYNEWLHCIQAKCKITLTKAYVAERLNELNDINNHQTKAFIKLYGEPYHKLVISWFEKSKESIS